MERKKNETELRGVTVTEQIEFKTTSFLERNKGVLIIGLAVVVVALIVLLVVHSVRGKQLSKAFDELDKAESRYTELVAMDNSSDEYKTGIASLKSTLQGFGTGKSYPALKAQYLLATIAYEEKDYSTAQTGFTDVYGKSKDTYLGALSLLNAAVAAEEGGDEASALANYTKVWDEYGVDCPLSPKALFNQARLQGKQGEGDLAKATYQQLIDQYPSSEYAKLAQTAILAY